MPKTTAQRTLFVLLVYHSFSQTQGSRGRQKGESLQHDSIPEEPQCVFEQEEEYTDGRQSAHHDRICPLRVCGNMLLPRLIEIVAIESDDGDREHELEDAEYKAYVSAKRRTVLE